MAFVTNHNYEVLSCLQPSSTRGLVASMYTILLLSSVALISPSVDNPVHSLMLSIHFFLGLPLVRVAGTVPCIISFSRQSPCFLITFPMYEIFLLFISSTSSRLLSTPAVSSTHSFIYI